VFVNRSVLTLFVIWYVYCAFSQREVCYAIMSKSSPFGEVSSGEPYKMLPLESCGVEEMTTAQRSAARRIAHDGLSELNERDVLQGYDVHLLTEDIFNDVQDPHFRSILPAVPGVARERTVQAWIDLKKNSGEQQVFTTPSYVPGLVCVVPSSLEHADRRAAKKQQHRDLNLVSEIATRVIGGVVSDEAVHHYAISPRTLVKMGNSMLQQSGEATFASRYGTAILPYIRKDGSLERAEDGEYWLIPGLRAEQRAVASLLPLTTEIPTPTIVTHENDPSASETYATDDNASAGPEASKPGSNTPRPAHQGRSSKKSADRRQRRTPDPEATRVTPSALTQALSAETLGKLAALRSALVDGSSPAPDPPTLPVTSEVTTAPQGEDAKVTTQQERPTRVKSGDGKPRTLADIPDTPAETPGRSIETFKIAIDEAQLRRRHTQEKLERLEALPESQLQAYLVTALQNYCEQRHSITVKTANSIFKDVILGKDDVLPANAGRDVSLLVPRSRELFDKILAQEQRLSRHDNLPFYVIATPESSKEQIVETHVKVKRTIQSVDAAVTHLLEKGVTSLELKELRTTSAQVGHTITAALRPIFMGYVRLHPQILLQEGNIHLYDNAEAKRRAQAEHAND